MRSWPTTTSLEGSGFGSRPWRTMLDGFEGCLVGYAAERVYVAWMSEAGSRRDTERQDEEMHELGGDQKLREQNEGRMAPCTVAATSVQMQAEAGKWQRGVSRGGETAVLDDRVQGGCCSDHVGVSALGTFLRALHALDPASLSTCV